MSRRRRAQRSNTMDQHHSRTGGTGSGTRRYLLPRKFLEELEQRVLLTTVITDTDPLTPAPSSFIFEYKDHANNAVRVKVQGDVTAEFIFARMTKGSEKGPLTEWNEVILGEPVPAGSKEDGRDLFHVYVAQATIDSYIAIAQVPDVTQTGPRPMQPFTGSVGVTIDFPNIGVERGKSTAGGTGGIILGTRTWAIPNVNNSGDRVIRSDNFNGLGIAPASIANRNGRLVAGFSTAQDVHLGRFMFGGMISGQVTIRGSMISFYCGQLMTGMTEGQTEGSPLAPGNFYVEGDIRNILVKGSIGIEGVASTWEGRAAPTWFTGVDFDIRGKAGQIRTGDDYYATATVRNTNVGNGLRLRQQEIEFRRPTTLQGQFTEFENGQFGDNEGFFDNDTFETAQFLGSINNKSTGANSIWVNGLLQWQPAAQVNDRADYYAVPLMAGQTIHTRLLSPTILPSTRLIDGVNTIVPAGSKTFWMHMGVFDPDNRLIASDYSNVDDTTAQNIDEDPQQQNWLSFTAEKPGIYRFAVGLDAPGFGVTPGAGIPETLYSLQILGVGQMALGGLVAENSIVSPISLGTIVGPGGQIVFDEPKPNVETLVGDLSAIYSIGDFIIDSGGGVTARVNGGDLRAVDALSIGAVNQTIYAEDIQVDVPGGSLGMIRGRGTTVGTHSTQFNLTLVTTGTQVPQSVIGGDIQYIVAPNTLITDARVNGSVGVIHVNQWGVNNYAGSLTVNADQTGAPGTIDLIDATANIGTLEAGGPIITVGPGGNVRYMHLANETQTAFRPRTAGGSTPEETVYAQGQNAIITDDSGANVVIEPTQEFSFDPATGGTFNNSGTLTVLTYPIIPAAGTASGGGSVIIRISSTRGLRVTSTGLVEIGDIVSSGSAPALIVNPQQPNGPDNVFGNGDEQYIPNPASFIDNSVTLRGGVVDVWNLRGNNFNQIVNNSPGEIVNAQVGQVHRIFANNIGFARSRVNRSLLLENQASADLGGHTGIEGDVFPYLSTGNAFTINAGVETSLASNQIFIREAIGNLMVNGIVENITANADGVGVRGVMEGIVGAVYVNGQIRLISVGEGLMPSGTGNFGRAGIYVTCTSPGADPYCGRIHHVIANNADIRGDIVSNTQIRTVEVRNGSIVNADIMVVANPAIGGAPTGTGADLSSSLEFTGGGTIQSGTNGVGDVNAIVVNGNGGIIGLEVAAANIQTIQSLGGFGIINSEFTVPGNGRIGDVVADGYGIRGGVFFGGQSLNSLNATGNGKRLNTTSFNPGVRFSESQPWDPFFGGKPGPLTDLHVVIGTNAANPQRKGTSASGSIDISDVRVSRDVNTVTANTIKATRFAVPNQLNVVKTRDYVDVFNITAGRLNQMSIGGDSLRSNFIVAGPVDVFVVGKNFRGSSQLQAQGPSGTINQFMTGGTLYGNVYAQRGINSIRVGSAYGSQGTYTAGNLGEFITNGDMLTDSVLRVKKRLNRLVVGGSLQEGALIRLGDLGTKVIVGPEAGTIQFE
jgi:hypothetical protein